MKDTLTRSQSGEYTGAVSVTDTETSVTSLTPPPVCVDTTQRETVVRDVSLSSTTNPINKAASHKLTRVRSVSVTHTLPRVCMTVLSGPVFVRTVKTTPQETCATPVSPTSTATPSFSSRTRLSADRVTVWRKGQLMMGYVRSPLETAVAKGMYSANNATNAR